MSYARSSYQQDDHVGMLPDLTMDLVRDYFIDNNYSVQNISLVKDFQYFLSKTEAQARNRQLFKDFVDQLTYIKIQPNGDKYLVLKEEQRVKRRPKVSNTKMPTTSNKLRLPSELSPPNSFHPDTSNGSPVLTSFHGNIGPSMRAKQSPIEPAMPIPVPKRTSNYPSPSLNRRSETFSSMPRTITPTTTSGRKQDLVSLMPSGMRINMETVSVNSSEQDRNSMDFSRSFEHSWVTACVTGNDEQIHRMLLEDSNFCHYQDYIYGYTALHWAAKQGQIEIIASLLMAGADVNIRSFGGHSALHLAAQQNSEKVIEFLVNQCGADVDARDNYGKPPSDYLPDSANKRCKYWLHKEANSAVYSPLHYSQQPKQDVRKMFGSQGELSTLERTASRIRGSFRRKTKALNLYRSNTVGTVNS